MSQIRVTRIGEAGLPDSPAVALADRIRQRAYQIYEQRGFAPDQAIDHWLEAERELTFEPVSQLQEQNGSFELTLAVTGFEANDLNVSAGADEIEVEGKATLAGGEKTLCSRFRLPAAIDVNQVTAQLESGVLRIMAPKAAVGARAAGAA